MSLDILTFAIFYLIIINSTLGYGYLAVNIANVNFKFFDHSYLGLVGVFVLLILSYSSHYFTSHNYIHNSIILISGILFFIYFFYKEKKKVFIINLNIFFLLLLNHMMIFLTIIFNIRIILLKVKLY